MHLDPVMPKIAMIGALLSIVGLVARKLRQPLVAGYLLTGVAVGPFGLGLLDDAVSVERIGSIGVVLLLFFLGMELSPQDLLRRWKVAVFGTSMQVAASVGLIAIVAMIFDWPTSRVFVIGFGISLSSTAVVVRILQDRGETNSDVGGSVTSILLAQDLAIVPMMLILQAYGDAEVSRSQTILQIVGGVCFLGAVVFMGKTSQRSLPFGKGVRSDHELQVFVALSVCFGMALVTAWLGLSTAAGAFLAGMLVHNFRETDWVEKAMRPFEVLLVAVFFLSVGMLIDLHFLRDHWAMLTGLLALVLVSNTLLNAGLLKLLGSSWRDGLYAGSMLSPIGEFSFVLVALGRHVGAVTEFGYQTMLALISLSLLFCSPWVLLVGRLRAPDARTGFGETTR